MGVSSERREAWDCDPASEAILSASLRASWASWEKKQQKMHNLEKMMSSLIRQHIRVSVDEPPAGAEFWFRALAAFGRFPAVAPENVSAALPHSDWSSSRLLCCLTGTIKKKVERRKGFSTTTLWRLW